MEDINIFSNTISILALIIAAGSLAWNIVRDFVLDRMKIVFSASVGKTVPIKNSGTGMFVDAGTFDHPNENPEWLLSMVNQSRRHIFLFTVKGKYKKAFIKDGKKFFTVVVAGLPLKLEPYAIFSTALPIQKETLLAIKKGAISSIWVEDTAGVRWYISRKNFKRLKDTVEKSLTTMN